MGDDPVSDPSPDERVKKLLGLMYPSLNIKPSETINYREVFTELCPKYMAYGATYEDFWFGDTFKLKMLRLAHREREKDANMQMWLQGQYNYHAVAVALYNAFLPKGRKAMQYLDRPFDIYGVSEDEAKKRAEEEAKRTQEAFRRWSIALKHKREKEHGTGSSS